MPAGWLAALRAAGSALVDFAFPPFCSLCRSGLADGERIVCAVCWAKLDVPTGPRCPRCGAPASPEARACANCAGKAFGFERAFVLASFGEATKSLVHLLKYREKVSLGPRLGRRLGEAMREDPEFRSMDLIVPVPLHRSRERERGYNQSALVARGLGQILGVPVSPRALRRNRGTRTQTELSAEERARNVEGAFEVRDPGKVAGLRVLLVDDVLTTGATLDAGAAALRKAGARQVYAAAIASPFRS